MLEDRNPRKVAAPPVRAGLPALALTLTLTLAGCFQSGAAAGEGTSSRGAELCRLKNAAIRESSGLAASRRTPGVFWTHNDSGGGARLFAFDARGRDLGTFALKTLALDWEDMAAVTLKGKHYLLVADTGDNWRLRPAVTLHWLEEPAVELPADGAAPRPAPGNGQLAVKSVSFRFPDGSHDCESVAVDPADGRVYLATKEAKGGACGVYALPGALDAPDFSGREKPGEPPRPLVAELVCRVRIPSATGMDISPDGLRMVIVTLRDGYEFTRAKGEEWKKALARKPRAVVLPRRSQGESVCYDTAGRFLYLTSECHAKDPACPLYRVEVPAAAGARLRDAD